MIKLHIIMSCFLISLASMSLATEESMILTHTYVDVISDENKMTIIAHVNGQVELTLPQFHRFYGKRLLLQNQQKSSTLFSKAQQIDYQLDARDLKNDIRQAKNNNRSSLFYSSDSDIYHLTIKKDQNTVWEISFSHFQELKHYADQLDRWQPLFELVESLENLSKDDVIATIVENSHEK